MSFSLFKVFEYKINNFNSGFDINYPFDAYGINFCKNSLEDAKAKTLKILTKCKIFTSLNMINNILNNIVLFCIGICIDVGLIRFTNQNLKRTKKLFAQESASLHQAFK